MSRNAPICRSTHCTKSCEFIYRLVEKTIKETLPKELNYLNSFDKAYQSISQYIEMPNNQIKQLITFILQNEGKLSKKKREKYYDKLTQKEIDEIEDIMYFSFENEDI